MNIQQLSQINFQSRSKTIRFADNMARKVNTDFPHISSSKVTCFKNYEMFPDLVLSLVEKTRFCMRFMKDELYDNAVSIADFVKAFIEPVKQYKIGNCGDCAHIAAIIAKVNNIKNCGIVHIGTMNGKDLDHAIVFVNEKVPYIIDPWLGFADYVPNALKRYEKEFKYCFDTEDGDIFTFSSFTDDEYTDFFKKELDNNQIKEILKKYPKLKL